MHNYLALETQMIELKERYSMKQREHEHILQRLSDRLTEEQERCSKIALQKNTEIQQFRAELDMLLDAMLSVQEQQKETIT